jgi:hypothetical protein
MLAFRGTYLSSEVTHDVGLRKSNHLSLRPAPLRGVFSEPIRARLEISYTYCRRLQNAPCALERTTQALSQ